MNRTGWKRLLLPVDPWLFTFAMIATLCGLAVIFDAGYARSILKGWGTIPPEFKMQLIYAVVSMVLGVCVAAVPIDFWRRNARWIILLAIVALFAVLIPGIGVTLNSATRWIRIGKLQIQPSEFAKVAVIVYLAAALSARKPWPANLTHPRDWADRLDRFAVPWLKRIWPLIVVGLIAMKIEREPDLGTASVILAVMMMMFWLGGVSRKNMLRLWAMGIIAVAFVAALAPYRLERIVNHRDLWSAKNVDDVGYQTAQSASAIAAGGVFGVGIGAGRAKHIMPAATTDFILATVGEETGLIGSICVLAIIGAVCGRLLILSRYAVSEFGRLLLLGICGWLAIQACVNMMMANGLLPPIGIPFPFFSSGGSSLIALWLAVGLAQAVAGEIPQEEEVREDSRDRRRHGRTRLSRT